MKNEISAANQNTEQNQNAAAMPSVENLPANTVQVTVSLLKDSVTFYLRMMLLNEEKETRQQLFGLTEAEQLEKSYQNNVELLKKLAVKEPGGIENFDQYFAVNDAKTERIAEYAVRAYFLRLTPNVSFLAHSA